jgi:hypothetical protein
MFLELEESPQALRYSQKFHPVKVGNDSKVILWLDHWHPACYLLDTFGYRIVHVSGLSLHSKLNVIIKNGD